MQKKFNFLRDIKENICLRSVNLNFNKIKYFIWKKYLKK